MDNLKLEIDSLEKQRSRLSRDIEARGNQNKGGIIKYVLVLIAGLIAGNLGSHHVGLNSYIN